MKEYILPYFEHEGDGVRTRRIMGGYGWVIVNLARFREMRNAGAMPAFARQFNLSCSACHVAYPRLSKFGFLSKDPPGPPFVGHPSKENYILIGIDAAL